jgi:hypothetical protein
MFCGVSCRDCYYVENNLHGIWQVVSIERFPSNEVIETEGNLYYMFQRSMIALSYKNLDVPESIDRYMAHFDFITSDSIGMGYFRIGTSGESGKGADELYVPLAELRPFGLYQSYTEFHLQRQKQKMILTSDSASIILRKY